MIGKETNTMSCPKLVLAADSWIQRISALLFVVVVVVSIPAVRGLGPRLQRGGLVDELRGPFDLQQQLAPYWHRQQPVLIRDAFPTTPQPDVFPTWETVLQLATNDDLEGICTSRLIQQHDPSDLQSFTVDFGPFDEDFSSDDYDDSDDSDDSWDEQAVPIVRHANEEEEHSEWSPQEQTRRVADLNATLHQPHIRSTLLVNDVDRVHPGLAAWMEAQFTTTTTINDQKSTATDLLHIPQWALDDAQISLATKGGGIGPHVDNYHVLLIQTAGVREWHVGTDAWSPHQEQAQLVPDCPVRVLGNHENLQRLRLEAGDVLYVPPRRVHWGIARSDDCVTLSVGFRAPSVSHVLARMVSSVAEALPRSRSVDTTHFSPTTTSLHHRLTDPLRQDVQEWVQAALKRELWDNPVVWDEIVGTALTEPLRTDELFVTTTTTMDTSMQDLLSLDHDDAEWKLQKTPGVRTVRSTVQDSTSSTWECLYSNGQRFASVHSGAAVSLLDALAESSHVSRAKLCQLVRPQKGEEASSSSLVSLLQDLVDAGHWQVVFL